MNAPTKNLLESLAAEWREAKEAERAANERRVAVETMIVAAMPGETPEETVNRDVAGLRVKVTYKVTRSVDTEALQAIWPSLSDKAQACFAWKATPKVGELRKVQEFLPAEYAKVATVIEAKPAKPSVSIEELA